MTHFRHMLMIAAIALIAIACTRGTPKESVAYVRTMLSEDLRKSFFKQSANEDLTETSRNKFLEAATAESVGSGFVVFGHDHDEIRMFITNKHVIEGGDRPLISFDDGHTLHVAQILYADPSYDLAVLTLKLYDQTHKGFGIAEKYENTEEVSALGYPVAKRKGTFQTTKGNISDPCIKQSDLAPEDKESAGGDACWIKHTASFDPGSSGGPLLTKSQKVAGVNTAFLPDKNSVFLAIPATAVNRALEHAEETLEHRSDPEWLRNGLKSTCRKFMDEIASSEQNYRFLHETISNALVAEYGHQALEFVMNSVSFWNGRIVSSAFHDSPIRALRGAILQTIASFIKVHDGPLNDERCQHLNANDDITKPGGTVRIAINLQDKTKLELTWTFEEGTWRLRDFNKM